MADAMSALAEFQPIVQAKAPLGPHTHLKLGGPAEALAMPRDVPELARLVRRCHEQRIHLRVLGGGCNILVREEGVPGVVVMLTAPPFIEIRVEGRRVHAGAGATFADLIGAAAKNRLAGLESLVGIPGTVGGALRHNTSDRSVATGQFIRAVEAIDAEGALVTRTQEELPFTTGAGLLDDPVLLAAEFEFEQDAAEAITRRMRKSWIQRNATQPYAFQAAARIFKNPAGLSASGLLEQAGVGGAKVGAAQVSDRDANYIVVDKGAAARDVLRLIDIMRTRVQERFHVELELEISVW